jgi:hypothetical protein
MILRYLEWIEIWLFPWAISLSGRAL